MRITRRRMLQMGVGSLLAAEMWPGVLSAKDPAAGAFHFLVLNDVHFLDQRSGPWCERVVAQIRRTEQPLDFVIIAGDLCENGTREQLGPVKEIFQTLRLPVHVVCGNHDYRTQTDRTIYDDLFPRQINYNFEHQGWQFVGLDTSDGIRYQNTAVSADTMRWLDDNLPRLNRERPTIVFTHFPMGPGVTYRPRNAADLLAKFREFNLQAVFCGHFHGFTEHTIGRTIITTNKCCAISRGNHDNTRQKGYFLCNARDGRVQRTFVEVPTA